MNKTFICDKIIYICFTGIIIIGYYKMIEFLFNSGAIWLVGILLILAILIPSLWVLEDNKN